MPNLLTYTLYGLTPATVRQPLSEDDLADALHEAHATGAAVVPWGSGTRQHLGAAPVQYDMAICTAALDQIVEYTPADLVVTVQAGATLGAVQAALAAHGQCLPWDPPVPPHATIGGLLASGASGPSRLSYGTPRDWTLGMRVVLGDGRVVKSGSKVVKNVAGYDTHKLHFGALGTLGVISEATFKVAPLPVSQRTLLMQVRQDEAVQAVEQLRAAPLAPVSVLVLNQEAQASTLPTTPAMTADRRLVIARFAGSPAAVARQIDGAIARCATLTHSSPETLDGEHDRAVWQALALFATGGRPEMLLRAGVRTAALAQITEALEAVATQRDWPVASLQYGGVGLTYARWSPPDDARAVQAALDEARQAVATVGGYVVVEDAPASLRVGLDLWGPQPQTIALMRALKAQWDERNILNRGRYLV